jgi:DNA polymerase
VADYSAIEARVLMWFCGETEATEMFRRGADIYVEMAKRISPSATRQLGKQAVLACGYGMGATKFQATCEGYGLNIDPVLAQQAVDTYRQTYSKVCTMWYSQENAAILAVRSGRPVNCGACKWFTDKGFLWCQLPSGRRLAYHKPEVKAGDNEQPRLTYMATDGVTKQYIRKDTYGGKIIENIIQATARDILAYALLAAEIKGYKPVMHVHDEIVCEVPEGQGGVKEFEKVICTLPKWADGCPITAEAYRGKRYRKG